MEALGAWVARRTALALLSMRARSAGVNCCAETDAASRRFRQKTAPRVIFIRSSLVRPQRDGNNLPYGAHTTSSRRPTQGLHSTSLPLPPNIRTRPHHYNRTAGAAMTDRTSRRDFVGLLAAGGAGALSPAWPASALAPAMEADLIVSNAKVYTMDPALPRAEAFA